MNYKVFLIIIVCLILFLIVLVKKKRESFSFQQLNVEVKKSPYLNYKSRGLFATKDYKKGDIIEECPTLIIDDKTYKKTINTIYSDHYFKGNIGKNQLLSLGYCSIINHSDEKQNCSWLVSDDDEKITVYAIKNINKGEELFSNYGKLYWKSRSNKV